MGMIYIIRHGKTAMNHANLLQGRSDIPLNEEGILQAQEAKEKLADVAFDAVYTSPLIRAVQTARILVPGLEPVADERLIEISALTMFLPVRSAAPWRLLKLLCRVWSRWSMSS